MDAYSMLQNKVPTQLTLGPSSRSNSNPDDPLLTPVSEVISPDAMPSPSTHSFITNEITGPPSRGHWKPDAEATRCDFPSCQITFGLLNRRHHCRKCGNIFCSAHCSNYFRLDQFSQFHPHGNISRGCDNCANSYRQWKANLKQMEMMKLQTKAPAAKPSPGDSVKTNTLDRHAGIMTLRPHAMEGVTELGRDDIVQESNGPQYNGIAIKHNKAKDQGAFNPISSVPADWQWSTF
ncbi:uncharacterized protein BYT42DRAFT_616524 [Radiomyces spectabilis]|uniref:uncharacterized protein n=1 Tax=Radiomyces spectabilis TaxID=64574 RepID=UPI002220D21F|nr:uncharacterized protein BYT42DRAFT_616524 [Radiomyces spectabilis]KAI8371433.1 hypothetical protein BYT42DRAFT_616524 [Radiomyces spectabilis]